jgi:Cdc6-like AAA superfamily ATPase
MTPSHIVETFNTHRMLPEVVRTLATGRDEEIHQVLVEIRHAAAHPETSPQHLIIYGERGSGKSFFLRMVESEVEHLARAENLPFVCALLPEEQYNIKSLPQLLEAIAAKVRGADWSFSAYAFDVRPAAAAWDEAVTTLHEVLDQRSAQGAGWWSP